MRRLVKNWYMKQDPYELVLEVVRVKARHIWRHADLIKLIHPKSDNIELKVVFAYLIRGFKKVEQEYKDVPEAQAILGFLQTIRELQTKDPGDVQQLVQMIEKHSFDLDNLPTMLLSKQPQIWQHAIVRTPLKVVMTNLRKMNSLNLLSEENDPLIKKLLAMFNDKHQLMNSKLKPLDILDELAQVESGWRLPPDGKHAEKQTKKQSQTKPHPSLAAGLKDMMAAAMVNVTKVPMSMLLYLDTHEKSGLTGRN